MEQPSPVPFVPISRQLLDSSVWETDLRVRVLWITMLMTAAEPARRGTVDMTIRALSGRAAMSPDDVRYALAVLESPDHNSRTPGNDGRRIERIDSHREWGWRILNWQEYEQARERMLHAARQARYRARNSDDGVTVRDCSVTVGDLEGEVEVEDEVEKSRGASAPLAPHARSRFVPPSESEWLAYCSKTWPDWSRHDILAAHGHYDGLGWAKVKSWRGFAKTCYHRQAGRPAPRNGRPAPTLIGSHPPGPELREVDESAPDDIVEIVGRLRRREATDDEVARLDAWQRGA